MVIGKEYKDRQSDISLFAAYKKPSGFEMLRIKQPSAPLTDEESTALLAIVANNPGVTWKPRQTEITKSNGIMPRKWESLGFTDYTHYSGWLSMNCRALATDLDCLFDNTNTLYE